MSFYDNLIPPPDESFYSTSSLSPPLDRLSNQNFETTQTRSWFFEII